MVSQIFNLFLGLPFVQGCWGRKLLNFVSLHCKKNIKITVLNEICVLFIINEKSYDIYIIIDDITLQIKNLTRRVKSDCCSINNILNILYYNISRYKFVYVVTYFVKEEDI